MGTSSSSENMSFTLPPLPYAEDALAPHISAETVQFHYGKHHAGYVSKLNLLTKDKPEASKSLEELVKEASGGIFNCAAQTWNHTFYWNCMAKGAGGAPRCAGRCDQRRVGLVRRVQEQVHRGRRRSLWFGLGLAVQEGRRQAAHRADARRRLPAA